MKDAFIRKRCSREATRTALLVSSTTKNNDNIVESSYIELENDLYRKCLANNGLKPEDLNK